MPTLLNSYQAGDQAKISWIDAYGTRHATTVTLAASPIA
jgi:hypothetical protein